MIEDSEWRNANAQSRVKYLDCHAFKVWEKLDWNSDHTVTNIKFEGDIVYIKAANQIFKFDNKEIVV